MKGEVNRRLRFMLRTVQAGLSAETGFGQRTVSENSADQEKSNKKMDSLLIAHKDRAILEVSIFLDSCYFTSIEYDSPTKFFVLHIGSCPSADYPDYVITK